MKIRVTGVLIENGQILLLNQKTDSGRDWSLPGGKVEEGESLETALAREMKEETGLEVAVRKLLYICDFIHGDVHVVHITFLVERTGGRMGDIAHGVDTNKIASVELVDIHSITEKGFSQTFQTIVLENFPGAGSYMGPKSAIGL